MHICISMHISLVLCQTFTHNYNVFYYFEESPYGSRPPASLRSADAASSAASKPGSKASLSGLSLPDESKAGNPFEAADDD